MKEQRKKKKTKWTHQERTEEEKEDKVEVSNVQATASLWRPRLFGVLVYGLWVTGSTTQTVQHDLLPRLPCCAPGQINDTGVNHHSLLTVTAGEFLGTFNRNHIIKEEKKKRTKKKTLQREKNLAL